MAFTYDPTTARGQVRLLVSDTDADAEIFSDAEIDLPLAGGAGGDSGGGAGAAGPGGR